MPGTRKLGIADIRRERSGRAGCAAEEKEKRRKNMKKRVMGLLLSCVLLLSAALCAPAASALEEPANLTAEYGTFLYAVLLPEGWEWENPADMVGPVGVQQHNAVYDGQVHTLDVTVTAIDISDAFVQPNFQRYTGQPVEVDPLGIGIEPLERGVDYDLSYENNIDPGMARVTVTGKGNCTGSVSFDYEIVERLEIADFEAMVQSIDLEDEQAFLMLYSAFVMYNWYSDEEAASMDPDVSYAMAQFRQSMLDDRLQTTGTWVVNPPWNLLGVMAVLSASEDLAGVRVLPDPEGYRAIGVGVAVLQDLTLNTEYRPETPVRMCVNRELFPTLAQEVTLVEVTNEGYGDMQIVQADSVWEFDVKRSGTYAILQKEHTRYGDVDADGKINAVDALAALKCSVKAITLNSLEEEIALVSGGENLTSVDALYILKYSVQKIDQFPVEQLGA